MICVFRHSNGQFQLLRYCSRRDPFVQSVSCLAWGTGGKVLVVSGMLGNLTRAIHKTIGVTRLNVDTPVARDSKMRVQSRLASP